MKKYKNRNGFSSIITILFVVGTIIVGSGVYFLLIPSISKINNESNKSENTNKLTDNSFIIDTNSPFLLVAHTQELTSKINDTKLELYDVLTQKLSSIKMYDNGELTQDANNILSKISKEPTLAFGQFGANGPGVGESIYPEVRDRIGQGMAIREYSISPDGNFIIFNVFKDVYDVCEKERNEIKSEKGLLGVCGSPESSDINTFYIYSKIDKSIKPFNSIKNLPVTNFSNAWNSINSGWSALSPNGVWSAWSPDSKNLYLISTGKDLRFYAIDWNARTYTKTYSVSLDKTLIYHDLSIEIFAPSHDGSKIALSVAWRGQDKNYSLWQQLQPQPKSAYSFYSEFDLYIFDINTGKTSKVIASGYETRGIAWSPDDSKVVANIWRREPIDVTKLEIFDALSLKLIWSSADIEYPSLPSDLDFSPDSVYMAYSTDSTGEVPVPGVSVIKFDKNTVTGISLPFSNKLGILFDGWLPTNK